MERGRDGPSDEAEHRTSRSARRRHHFVAVLALDARQFRRGEVDHEDRIKRTAVLAGERRVRSGHKPDYATPAAAFPFGALHRAVRKTNQEIS